MKPCEHCGSTVKLTPVCAKCTRDHSAEWLAEGLKEDRKLSLFWKITFFVSLPILALISACLDLSFMTTFWGTFVAMSLSAYTAEYIKT